MRGCVTNRMKKRWILLTAVAGLLALGYASGAWHHLTDEQELRRLLLQSGPWGGVLFVALFTVLVALGSPAMFLIVPASIVWPFAQASLLVYLGALGSAALGFAIARYGARDAVEKYLPTRVRVWDERLESNGFGAALTLRMIFYCAPWTNWVLGLSRVRVGAYVAATLIGFVPWTLLWVYIGAAGFAWLREQSTGVLLGLAAVVIAFVAIRAWRRRREAPLADELTAVPVVPPPVAGDET